MVDQLRGIRIVLGSAMGLQHSSEISCNCNIGWNLHLGVAGWLAAGPRPTGLTDAPYSLYVVLRS